MVLLATLAVVHSQTFLYPSAVRQASWPVQSQYPVQSISVSPSSQWRDSLYPASIYRYPYQLQFLPYQRPYTQYQYIHPSLQSHTPKYQYVQTAVTSQPQSSYPLYWTRTGRSFGDVPTTGHSPVVGQSPYVGQQSVVDSQSYRVPVNSGYSSVPSQGHVQEHAQGHVQSHYQPATVGTFVPNTERSAVAAFTTEPQHISAYHHGGHVSPVHIPVAFSPSVPMAQIPVNQGVPYTGAAHQESVGHHQVSHVSIPGQVGVGGGYTSAAFYETAPTGVVIPSLPFSSEPIVASDVKVMGGKSTVEPVHGQIQSHVTGQQHHHHQTVGVQAY